VANEKEFQQKVRQLGTLVGEFDQSTGSGTKVVARELVQLLMEVHCTGLERIMELVFGSGADGEAMIGRLGQDPIVRNLLLLYSLHPEDLETRVLKALDTVATRLHKFDSKVELISLRDGHVQLQFRTHSHGYGSAKNLRSIVEESIYELAPDLASLTILGLEEEERAAGFVTVESLLKHPSGSRVLAVHSLGADSAD